MIPLRRIYVARGCRTLALAIAASIASVCTIAISGCDCGSDTFGALPGGGTDAQTEAPQSDDQISTTPPPALIINEVVLYPKNDWSDPNGNPYDAVAGNGPVTGADEFIELYNASNETVDLTGWTLQIKDLTAATTTLGVDGTLVFSGKSTLERFLPGDYAVLGNPNGFSSTDAYVVLRAPTGVVVDDVEIGGATELRDMERDGVGDGAPSPEANAFARGTFEEAIARFPNGQDTDDDQHDFIKMPATPGEPNEPPETPDETDPPFLINRAEGDAFAVTDPIWVRFSEPIAPQSTDNAITVSGPSGDIALGFHTFDERDAMVVVNPIGVLPHDATLTVRVLGGTIGVTDLAGNALADDIVYTIHTEPRPVDPASVLINEMCVSPQSDWNDDDGGDGVPYSEIPGTGSVDSSDEWIELLVKTATVVDLSNYTLIVYNGPNTTSEARSVTEFGSSFSTARIVGRGTSISAVWPDDRIVVGNPSGALQVSVYVELRDEQRGLVDSVEVGGNTALTDRGGDGIANGAPEAGADGSSTSQANETLSRVPDGADTGDDVTDWSYSAATPGEENE